MSLSLALSLFRSFSPNNIKVFVNYDESSFTSGRVIPNECYLCYWLVYRFLLCKHIRTRKVRSRLKYSIDWWVSSLARSKMRHPESADSINYLSYLTSTAGMHATIWPPHRKLQENRAPFTYHLQMWANKWRNSSSLFDSQNLVFSILS